jgi:hydroxysqualene dehydroxylase
MKSVVVIGGGVAGLATAVDLAARGVRVTVLEGRRRLGGRASSFADKESGESLDNGPHAMMGCYRSALAFIERIGASGGLRRQANLRVDLIDPQLGGGALACPDLPSPLHVAGGMLRYALLSPREKLHALLAGLRLVGLRRRGAAQLASQSVAEVLRRLGQSPQACRRFWFPVAIATCNELPERAAAAPFAEVVALAFFGSRADSQFVFSRVGLTDLYAEPARRFVERHGGRVLVGSPVERLEIEDDRVTAALLRGGERHFADAFVSALPPAALHALLPTAVAAEPPFRACPSFAAAPIVSAHLWLDRPVLEREFVGLLDTTAQWVFDVDRLWHGRRGTAASHLAAVVSAAHEVVDWPNGRIADVVLDDLRRLVPAAREAQLQRSLVVKERAATISTTPAAERLRPGTTTPLSNLLLAGDWTATGLPPTIESAARSALWAAQAALDRLAQTERAAA